MKKVTQDLKSLTNCFCFSTFFLIWPTLIGLQTYCRYNLFPLLFHFVLCHKHFYHVTFIVIVVITFQWMYHKLLNYVLMLDNWIVSNILKVCVIMNIFVHKVFLFSWTNIYNHDYKYQRLKVFVHILKCTVIRF